MAHVETLSAESASLNICIEPKPETVRGHSLTTKGQNEAQCQDIHREE